jgi:ferric-dicitrate binding protein FerR (iron transport regulator)
VRLRSPEATDRDRADFESWLAADPRNREAFQRSANLWPWRPTRAREPLEDVIAELNRYAAAPMVIEDDALRGLRVSGRFKVADQQSIRFMLHETLGVQFTARDDKVSLTAKR